MQQKRAIYTMIVYRTERRACIIVIEDPVILANNHTVFTLSDIWLKYCRYDTKHQTINHNNHFDLSKWTCKIIYNFL